MAEHSINWKAAAEFQSAQVQEMQVQLRAAKSDLRRARKAIRKLFAHDFRVCPEPGWTQYMDASISFQTWDVLKAALKPSKKVHK